MGFIFPIIKQNNIVLEAQLLHEVGACKNHLLAAIFHWFRYNKTQTFSHLLFRKMRNFKYYSKYHKYLMTDYAPLILKQHFDPDEGKAVPSHLYALPSTKSIAAFSLVSKWQCLLPSSPWMVAKWFIAVIRHDNRFQLNFTDQLKTGRLELW